MNPAHQASSSRSQIGLACIANTEQALSFLKDAFPLVRFSPDFIVHLLTSYTDAVVGLVKFSLCSLRAFRKGGLYRFFYCVGYLLRTDSRRRR